VHCAAGSITPSCSSPHQQHSRAKPRLHPEPANILPSNRELHKQWNIKIQRGLLRGVVLASWLAGSCRFRQSWCIKCEHLSNGNYPRRYCCAATSISITNGSNISSLYSVNDVEILPRLQFFSSWFLHDTTTWTWGSWQVQLLQTCWRIGWPTWSA
jgi:hypothetical protein